MKLQGKYPVIYLSFKDEKHSSLDGFIQGIKELISSLYIEHIACLNNNELYDIEKVYYDDVLNQKKSLTSLGNSLKKLSKYLENYYGEKVIILIDEYDVPIQAAYLNNYYSEAIEFMRNLLSGAFKDNTFLQKAMITGILRVAKESIFSGLNNLKVESILSENLCDKFGFTDSEIEALVSAYDIEEELQNIKGWYNGYYFGNTTIYNPWSILNYLSSPKAGLKPYWVNSSSNDLVNVLLAKGSEDVKKDLEVLISGESITKLIDENIVMGDIEKSSDNLWSFLLFTGYLKVISKERIGIRDYYKLSIPNLEVTTLYYGLIETWFKDTITKETYDVMINSLVTGDIKIFGKLLKQFVLKSISYFDVGGYEGEKVYHAFVLGMLISLNDSHEVISNRESGYGRYDVMIIPKDISKLGIVIEFKKLDPDDEETLEETADMALKQIKEKKYSTALEDRGVKNIKEIGIVFKGKDIYIKE
jgi:hypothetical protein